MILFLNRLKLLRLTPIHYKVGSMLYIMNPTTLVEYEYEIRSFEHERIVISLVRWLDRSSSNPVNQDVKKQYTFMYKPYSNSEKGKYFKERFYNKSKYL